VVLLLAQALDPTGQVRRIRTRRGEDKRMGGGPRIDTKAVWRNASCTVEAGRSTMVGRSGRRRTAEGAKETARG